MTVRSVTEEERETPPNTSSILPTDTNGANDHQIRSHLQIQTYHYLTRSSLRLPIPTMKSEALTTK